MEENTTYKKFVYLILKLLFMLLLLGALFYFWQNMPLAVLLSFSIGVVAISCSFVVEFFGFDQKTAKLYTVSLVVSYIAVFIIPIWRSPAGRFGRTLVALAALYAFTIGNKKYWKEVWPYLHCSK